MLKLVWRTLLKRRGGFVLFGHGLTTTRVDDYIEKMHKDFGRFKQVITTFEDVGFAFISIDELIRLARKRFVSTQPWVHLTFDDGYRNIYDLAYPYLKERGIPFSLFVSTNHVATGERYYPYKIRCAVLHTSKNIDLPGLNLSLPNSASRSERIEFCNRVLQAFKLMSKPDALNLAETVSALLSAHQWQAYDELYRTHEVLTVEQLKELANDSLVHIGSHNHHHIILNRNVSRDDMLYEMETSKRWLAQHLNIEPVSYCYPNGGRTDFSESSKEICQALGYQIAFTTLAQPISSGTDMYELPRFVMPTRQRHVYRRVLKLMLNYETNLR